MAFRPCVSFDTPRVTKMVLSKVLQNLKLYLLDQGIEPKKFSYFPRLIQYRVRLQYPPFNFFAIVRRFPMFFPPKGPLHFFGVLRQNGC